MSTKIYYAYKYNAGLPELMVELKKLRELYLSTEFIKDVSVLEEKLHDVVRVGIYETMKAIEARLKYDCVMVYEYDAILYIHIFCAYNREAENILIDYLDSNKSFEDYHYQNSSDKPDSVTNAEWKKREKTWDNIFFGTPSESGLTWELYSKDCYEL
jgi:hypothetical protein